jgi:hypothetical protein
MDSQKNLSFLTAFEQTINFIQNRLVLIAISSVVLAVASSLLTSLLLDPSAMVMMMYGGVGSIQFLRAFFGILLLLLLLSLLLKAITLAIIYNLSESDKFDLNLISSRILPAFLNLVGFSLIYLFLAAGISFVLVLIVGVLGLVLPERFLFILLLLGMIATMLFVNMVFAYFSASLIRPDSKRFGSRFCDVHRLVLTNFKAPLIMMLINFAVIITLSLVCFILGNNIVISMITSVLTTFLSFFVCTFFFRLYNVSNDVEQQKLDSDNSNNQQIIS